MLQLQTKTIDICRISKLLVKYNIKASITNQVITLDGDVSDELLTKLCDNIEINSFQNYINHEALYVPKETSFIKSDEHCTLSKTTEKLETKPAQSTSTLPPNTVKHDLIYSKVKRGEVYLCDFGEPYGSEQGFERHAIVVQNDDGNSHSLTTIVIPCTTKAKNRLPTHGRCRFSSKNMIDYNLARIGSEENTIMTEQIRTIDKTRLRKYLGTLTPEFMKKLQDKIDISLDLSREVKTIVNNEKSHVEKPVVQKTEQSSKSTRERKDVNMIQVQLLSFVDINELLKISQSFSSDEVKAEKILGLFGFDFKKNGVQHLLEAIISSPKNSYFNLETLCRTVSKKENIDAEEIKRLIVARVKENFGFKKAPTIDFIRLVNNFLLKQEDNDYEKVDI